MLLALTFARECNRLRSRRACIHIPLTRLHKQANLNGAQDHVNWTDNDWDPVYSSPLHQGTVLTLQMDVLECGEDVGSDFKMPISPNMTAIRGEEQNCKR